MTAERMGRLYVFRHRLHRNAVLPMNDGCCSTYTLADPTLTVMSIELLSRVLIVAQDMSIWNGMYKLLQGN